MRVVAFALICSMITAAAAQSASSVRRVPEVGSGEIAGSTIYSLIPNAPFTSRVLATFTRKLQDGNTLTTKLAWVMARDSRGRVLAEDPQIINASGKQAPAVSFTIIDPNEKTFTRCVLRDLACVVAPFHTFTVPQPAKLRLGDFDEGSHHFKRETLGTKVIEGVETIGIRETRTTKAGTIGNARPMVTTSEDWYSQQIGVNLSMDATDPQSGKRSYRVVDVTLGEPTASLFDIPAGYEVERRNQQIE
jgi:hypothetical protein